MKMLFEEVFRPEDVMVKRYGNVLSPTASVQAIDFTEHGEMSSTIGIRMISCGQSARKEAGRP